MDELPKLNFPEQYEIKCRRIYDILEVFDITKKKWVKLTPEEWVRQNILHFIHKNLNYPTSLIKTEAFLKYNNLSKRADILVYDRLHQYAILVECKSYEVKLNESTLYQIFRYNTIFLANQLIISNGYQHFCFAKNEKDEYKMIYELTSYEGRKVSIVG